MTEQTIRIKNNLPKVIKGFSPAQMKAVKTSIGLRLQKALKERINEGDSRWAPLSPAWAEKKGHGGQWYYTGQLGKAIEYKLTADGVRVGVLAHDSYPDGESVATVATAMEYGTSDIPARPLFAPVFEEQAVGIVKDAADDIVKRIKKAAV